MNPLRLAVSIFFVLISLQSFSQSGIYERVKIPKETPKEAKGNFVDSEGVFEFPIYIGSGISVIKLKITKRVVIVYDKGEDTEQVYRGQWELEGEIIRLIFEASIGTMEYKLVEYESGTYLESTNGRIHYKKQ